MRGYILGFLTFEWDEEKYEINRKKHGISFEEAQTVFDDDNSIYKRDIKHSVNEERFYVLGMSAKPRLLLVCHCIRDGNVVRIFSARPAKKSEKLEYESRR